jgi:predicted AlkP superfamily pyrophosphatase or phosphodiesterase
MAEPDGGRHSRRRWVAAGGVLVLTALSSACGNSLTQPSAVPSAPIANPSPASTPTPPPPPPRVVLVSIDGLRADVVSAENTPSIWALVARAAYTFSAQTISPSNTLPGHASMLTGVEPGVHGITFDDYQNGFQFSTPTALSLVHAAGKRSVMIVGKDKFRQLISIGSVDSYVESKYGDDDIVNEAIARMPLGFDLMFVHLPQVDQIGHYAGWMSADYMNQVKNTDSAFGRLVANLPPGATIILTSDHGGSARIHGTTAKTDLTIPWIIAGPRILRRGAIARNVRTTDTALTILAVLNITAPSNCTGRTVSEIFDAP